MFVCFFLCLYIKVSSCFLYFLPLPLFTQRTSSWDVTDLTPPFKQLHGTT